MVKEFKYRGFSLPQLQQMSMDEFIKLLPSQMRRRLLRGMPADHRKILELIRKQKKAGAPASTPIKTHCRDMVILPEMVGITVGIHNGKEFVNVEIKVGMVGHLLGEFAITNKKVVHGNPGIGASRSSMYVPLK